jgi:hypothetical protein
MRQQLPFTLLTAHDLATVADPDWLVEGLVPQAATILIFGPSGAGKSFYVLDQLLSISQGIPFFGRTTQPGPVVYVAAEGQGGIKNRVAAWALAHGHPELASAFFILGPVDLTKGDEVEAFIAAVREKLPTAVAFDTLAQCSSGDENAAEDMKLFLRGIGRIHRELQATVILVHHSTKAKASVERGSSVLRAAADVVIRLDTKGQVISVTNDKQKDDEPAPRLALRLRPVSLPVRGTRERRSAVLDPMDSDDALAPAPRLSTAQLRTLRVLVDGRLESGAWRVGVTVHDGQPISKDTFQKHRAPLLEGGFVEKDDRGYGLTALGYQTIEVSHSVN